MQQQLSAVQSHIGQAVDEYKAAYPLSLKFDYTYRANEAPFVETPEVSAKTVRAQDRHDSLVSIRRQGRTVEVPDVERITAFPVTVVPGQGIRSADKGRLVDHHPVRETLKSA
jgi:murein tripeptide amidase MpaA